MDVAAELVALARRFPVEPGFADIVSLRAELLVLRERCRGLGGRGRAEVERVESELREVERVLDARADAIARAVAEGAARGAPLFETLAALSEHPLDLATPHVGDEPADFLVERLFGTNGRFDGGAPPGREMIHYEPSPVSATLTLARLGWFEPGTTFVDLGSGIGRVPILASLLSGARTVGVEIDPALARVAIDVAARLRADVDVRVGDARTTPLEDGDAFFFFAPFVGTVLEAVLDRLAHVATRKPIRIGSWGPSSDGIAAHGAFVLERANSGPFHLVTFRPR